MKNKARKIVDAVMTFLFIILMGYHITGNYIHEILGLITILLVILHNILNIKWYKSTLKGKYNFQRTIHTILNLLLLLASIGIAISSMIISSNVFSFLNIHTTMFGRRLHILSTSWGYVLISAHIGLHLNSIMSKINKKMKKSTFEYVYYFLLTLIIIYGGYSFVKLGILEDMFIKNDFKFFDFDKSPIIFYLQYVAILICISFIIYGIILLIKNIIKNKKKERFE